MSELDEQEMYYGVNYVQNSFYDKWTNNIHVIYVALVTI